MEEGFDWLQTAWDDFTGWLRTDSDNDGYIDWDLRDIAGSVGEAVGNVIDPVTESVGQGVGNIASGLSLPLILAAGVAVVALRK